MDLLVRSYHSYRLGRLVRIDIPLMSCEVPLVDLSNASELNAHFQFQLEHINYQILYMNNRISKGT